MHRYTVFTKEEIEKLYKEGMFEDRDHDGVKHFYISEEKYEAMNDRYAKNAEQEKPPLPPMALIKM